MGSRAGEYFLGLVSDEHWRAVLTSCVDEQAWLTSEAVGTKVGWWAWGV